MNHILDVTCRSQAYSEIFRDTIFMIILHPEMHRDTVFTIIVYPDMYDDTVFIGGVFPCLLCGCTRASLCLLSVLELQTNTLFPEVFSRDSLS